MSASAADQWRRPVDGLALDEMIVRLEEITLNVEPGKLIDVTKLSPTMLPYDSGVYVHIDD